MEKSGFFPVESLCTLGRESLTVLIEKCLVVMFLNFKYLWGVFSPDRRYLLVMLRGRREILNTRPEVLH